VSATIAALTRLPAALRLMLIMALVIGALSLRMAAGGRLWRMPAPIGRGSPGG
jgi:hypothetical protein